MDEDFDLIHFREKMLKITREDLANRLAISLEKLDEMERHPEDITFSALRKLSNIAEIPFDKISSYQDYLPQPFAVKDTWHQASMMKTESLKQIEKRNVDESVKSYIEDIKNILHQTIVKPSVAIVGMSDAGKSTLINTLLGEDKLPAAWTPTTSISVHIKHIDDRPSFIKDEVWVFKGDKTGFDMKKVHEESYSKKMKLAGGDASILSKFGVRQNSFDSLSEEAIAAVIYVQSPILKVCDIVDLPGFGTGDRKNDDVLAQKSKEFADIVIYLSIANGFLRGTDIEFIKSALNGLPTIENKNNGLKPLNNFFIVASQAHTINDGNLTELHRILEKGTDRLYSLTPEEIWKNKHEQSGYLYTRQDIRNRFFTFSKEKSKTREKFEQELRALLEQLPQIIQQQGFDTVRENVNRLNVEIENKVAVQKDIISERNKYVALLNDVKANEKTRQEHNAKSRETILKLISTLETQSIKEFKNEYDRLINVESIVRIMEEKKYTKKKEDIEFLAGYLTSKVQMILQETLKKKSEKLAGEVEHYLKEFEIQVKKFDKGLSTIQIPFDPIKIFASGLAGAATLGGLAAWASTLGNLGAYILVAKGVSVLSAIGISVSGGVAGAVAGVAALGGPIVLGIALAAIVSMSVFAILSGGSRRKVAKKLVESYDEQNVVNRFNKEISNFWDETREAFNTSAEHLENEWKKSIDNLTALVHSYDKKDIEFSIENLNQVKQILETLNFSQDMISTEILKNQK